MKVKGFWLWHLWQVLTLEDIFSYFTLKNVLYAIFVKNTCLCMHIFLFHERDKSIKCDIYGKYWLCIHILSFHDETNFQMWCVWKILAFLYIFHTGTSFSNVIFEENVSIWRHLSLRHESKRLSAVTFVASANLRRHIFIFHIKKCLICYICEKY